VETKILLGFHTLTVVGVQILSEIGTTAGTTAVPCRRRQLPLPATAAGAGNGSCRRHPLMAKRHYEERFNEKRQKENLSSFVITTGGNAKDAF
jgi:hypothetical protein